MNNLGRNIFIWVIIGIALMSLFNLFQNPVSNGSGSNMAYTDFVTSVQSGKVSDVTIEGANITARTKDNHQITSYVPEGADIVGILTENDVRIEARPDTSNSPGLFSLLLSWFPMLLFIGVWIFFMRQMQGGGRGGAMGFGKSRAKLLTEAHGRVTFDDVAGIDEAKTELEEVVEFLKTPASSSVWAVKSQKVSCLLALQVLVKHCLQNQLLARQMCHSSQSQVQTLLRCLSVLVRLVCVICSSRARKAPLVSSLLTRLMLLVAIAALVLAAVMMNANKHLTRCLLKWMVSRQMKV